MEIQLRFKGEIFIKNDYVQHAWCRLGRHGIKSFLIFCIRNSLVITTYTEAKQLGSEILVQINPFLSDKGFPTIVKKYDFILDDTFINLRDSVVLNLNTLTILNLDASEFFNFCACNADIVAEFLVSSDYFHVDLQNVYTLDNSERIEIIEGLLSLRLTTNQITKIVNWSETEVRNFIRTNKLSIAEK